MFFKNGCNSCVVWVVAIIKQGLYRWEVNHRDLQSNLQGTKICEVCGERFIIKSKKDTSSKYCENCKYDKEIEKYSKYNKKRI